MVKISVVIPVYNGARYLRECLDSILQQTLSEFEVICIDDASEDLTPVILDKYNKKDHRLKFVRNTSNCGAGSARNKGLDLAEGKYILFLDADDVFESNMLEQIYLRAECYQADICVFSEDSFQTDVKMCEDYSLARLFLKQLEQRGAFSPEDIRDVLFNVWNGWAWDKLFCRNFIMEKGIRFQEMESSEDAFFVYSLLVSARRIVYLNTVYVHHRLSSSSLSNSRDGAWDCFYKAIQEIKKYLIECRKYNLYKDSFLNWAIDFTYWNYFTLNEQNREELFYALKGYILQDLGLIERSRETFYNTFYYWFVQSIYSAKQYSDSEIPVDCSGRWKRMLWENEEKIERVFQYLEKHQYYAGVWGMGERGKTFIEKYGSRKEIKKVYDQDRRKAGEKLNFDCYIEPFNEKTSMEIDFIFVMNTLYFRSIVEKVKGIKPDTEVFDLEVYQNPGLSFPMSMEECIM